PATGRAVPGVRRAGPTAGAGDAGALQLLPDPSFAPPPGRGRTGVRRLAGARSRYALTLQCADGDDRLAQGLPADPFLRTVVGLHRDPRQADHAARTAAHLV